MKRKDLSSEDRTFLELIAKNVWQARREGVVVGTLYTLGVLGCGYLAVFQIGISEPLSFVCYLGILAIWFDAYRRVFKRP